MADYTEIDVNDLLPGEPWTSAKANAAFENPVAIAEGASGSPLVEVAWHFLEAATLASDGTTVTLTTDISPYRAIRLIGGAAINGAATSATVDVDLEFAAGWSTAIASTYTSGGGEILGFALDVTIHEIDNADGLNRKFASGHVSIGDRGPDDWDEAQYAPAGVMAVSRGTGAALAVRVNSTQTFDVSEGTPRFWLYGVKRTAA